MLVYFCVIYDAYFPQHFDIVFNIVNPRMV